jgi:hydrogenase maturation protease
VSRIVVAVIGSRLRGDDAAGPLVADALRAARAPVHVVEAGADPLSMLDAWDMDDMVFVVDAVTSGAPPGTIHELTAKEVGGIPERGAGSTHGFGLAMVVELARTLGRLPRQLTVVGIEGGQFEIGAEPHADVRRAAAVVADRIAGVARAEGRTRS